MNAYPAAAGVVVEEGFEYRLTHTGQRELDGRPIGVWVRLGNSRSR